MVLGCDWCHIFEQLVLLRVEPVRLIIYRACSDTVKYLHRPIFSAYVSVFQYGPQQCRIRQEPVQRGEAV